MLVFIYISIAIFVIAFIWIKKRYQYWTIHGIPQLTPIFPYGNLKEIRLNLDIRDIFDNAYKKYKNKSKIVGLYFFINRTALILDIDIIRNILIKDFNNFMNRGVYVNEEDDPLAAHLFSLEGQQWKSLRSKLTPVFSSGKMKSMFFDIIKIAKELDRVLSESIKINSKIEIEEFITQYTTDVIVKCAFGIESNCLNDPNAMFRKYGRKLNDEPVFRGILRQLKHEFRNISKLLKVQAISNEVTQFFIESFRNIIQLREDNNIKRNDVMDILIQLKNQNNNFKDLKNLTMNQVSAQAFVFFLAGFANASIIITFILYELSRNEEIQNKLRAEIINVLEKYNNDITYDGMMEMNYLEQVINEGLRKYPVISGIQRKTVNDYHVPNTDIVIEKGIKVWIPLYSIHYDPDYYVNPNLFDPERFSSENLRKRDPMTFLPFGNGPRNCLGLRFGKLQIQIAIIALVRSFKFSLNSTEVVKLLKSEPLTAIPKGLKLNIEKI